MNDQLSNGLQRWVIPAVGLAIVIAAGGLSGHYSQRWGPPVDLQRVADHLNLLPRTIGDWQAVEDLEIDSTTLQMLDCAGYVNRRYVNNSTGETINLAMMAGPPGPIAVHVPEVCYSSRDYEIQTQREEVVLQDSEAADHSFWAVKFAPRNKIADQLVVYYAWNPAQQWIAAARPRFAFGASKLLVKLQLAGTASRRTESQVEDPCKDFLSALLKSGWSLEGFKESTGART